MGNNVDTVKLKDALKEVKPSLTEKQSIKPMKNKVLINNTPDYAPPEPPYHPSQNEIYAHLIQQRQQQAYMRHQAMLAPYANMFASRAHWISGNIKNKAETLGKSGEP